MFYDKSIGIIGTSEGYLDDLGVWHPGTPTTVKTIEVDVQAYSKELAYRDYGFNENVVYRIFSDPDNLIMVGTKIEYANKPYIIKKIVDWDSYYDWMIDDE